jgi:molybdenum cofactor synthesis domain-containing protein
MAKTIFSAAVITCSDKGARGLRVDTSGEYIKEFLIEKKFNVLEKVIITDDLDTIKNKLLYYTDEQKVDLIITTGGTGFSPRDNTPEATKDVIKREVPGIGEMLRSESYKVTPRAYLSRGISGIRDRTLIINLPGSLKAVKENLSFLGDVLDHGLKILKLVDTECGT